MLSKETFKKELLKLIVEFRDKGFKMPKERIEQWYDYLKIMSDDEFTQKIDYVIKNCSYVPSIADVFKANIADGTSYKPFDFSDL